MAWWNVRILSFLGLLLLPGGLFVWAFAVGFSCFDTCVPDIGANALRTMLLYPLPGLLCAGSASARAVLLLRGRGQRWRLAVVLLAPVVCLVAGALLLTALDGGRPIPLDEGQIVTWERAMTWPLFIVPIWPLVTLLASIAPPGDVAPGA